MSHDATTVERVISHRYPIRLVDRVLDVDPGRSLTALSAGGTFRPAHELLVAAQGADRHTVPPGLVLESLLQTAAVLRFWETPNPDVSTGRVELAVGLSGVALRRPVRAGEDLEHRVEVVRRIDCATTLTGRTLAAGEEVAVVGEVLMTTRTAAELGDDRASKGARS